MYTANYMLNTPQYGVLDNPYMNYAQPKDYSQADWNSMVSNAIVGENTAPDLSPFRGSILGFLGNTFGQAISQYMQYSTQRNLMDRANAYNSPKEMMKRMVEAGINPNAAAQGIAGAPGAGASSTPAAGLTSNNANLADLLANSVNTALNADVLRSEAGLNNANAEYTKSQNVEQQVRNRYADLEHNETLKNLVYRNVIDKSQGEIIAADAKYAGANAYAHWMTTMETLRKISNEADVLDQKYYTEMANTYATMMAGNLSEAQIHKVFSDIGLNNAQIAKISKECENIAADTLLKGQQMSESEAPTAAAAAAKSLQSCPTLCDPRDGSPTGSSIPGILQARILEWVAISFSNE